MWPPRRAEGEMQPRRFLMGLVQFRTGCLGTSHRHEWMRPAPSEVMFAQRCILTADRVLQLGRADLSSPGPQCLMLSALLQLRQDVQTAAVSRPARCWRGRQHGAGADWLPVRGRRRAVLQAEVTDRLCA